MSSPGFNSSIAQYYKDQSKYLADRIIFDQEFDALMSEAKNTGQSMQAVIGFIQVCMPGMIQLSQDNIQIEADAANVATGLRSQVTSVQQAYNNLLADIQNKNSAQAKIDAQALNKAMQQMQEMLHASGLTHVMGSNGAAELGQISNYLAQIVNLAFGSHVEVPHLVPLPPSIHYDILNVTVHVRGQERGNLDCNFHNFSQVTIIHLTLSPTMAALGTFAFSYLAQNLVDNLYACNYFVIQHAYTWNWQAGGVTTYNYKTAYIPSYPHIFTNMNNIYNRFISNDSSNNPLQMINSDFNALNQSVSGISSSIQAQMNYLNQNLQQYYGFYNGLYQDINQVLGSIIQNFGG